MLSQNNTVHCFTSNFRMLAFLILLTHLLLLDVVHGIHNITLDDSSSQIIYSNPEQWEPISVLNSSLDYGGAHMASLDSTATATLVFTGVAVYFMSPLWMYPVTTALSLDSSSPVLVNLTDPLPHAGSASEVVGSQVVWGMTGLSNTQHTLVASVGKGQKFVVVDAIIYTVLDSSDLPPSSTPPSQSSLVASSMTSISTVTNTSVTTSTPTTSSGSIITSVAVPSSGTTTASGLGTVSGSTSSLTLSIIAPVTTDDNTSADTSNTHHTLAIAVGSACGAVGLAIFFGLLMFCCRRQTPTGSSTGRLLEEKRNSDPGPTRLVPRAFTPLSPPGPYRSSIGSFPTHPQYINDPSPSSRPWIDAIIPPGQYKQPRLHQYQAANMLSTISKSDRNSPHETLPHLPNETEFGYQLDTDSMTSTGGLRPDFSSQSVQHHARRQAVMKGRKHGLMHERPDSPTDSPPPAYVSG